MVKSVREEIKFVVKNDLSDYSEIINIKSQNLLGTMVNYQKMC